MKDRASGKAQSVGRHTVKDRHRRDLRSRRRARAMSLYAIWVTFVLIASWPTLAQLAVEENMEDEYDYDLTFPADGEQSHYRVERLDTGKPGRVELTYTTSSHTLEVEVTNIRSLVIDCRSVFEDEGVDVFGSEALAEDNLYLDYFLQRDTFHVVVDANDPVTSLSFEGAPAPVTVRVDSGDGPVIWARGHNYTVTGTGGVDVLVLSDIPAGLSYVDIDFMEEDEGDRDTDGDGTNDDEDLDDDGDGYPDDMESELGTDPKNPWDVPPDLDSDLIPDELDFDDDGDGVTDLEEVALGTDPKNPSDYPLSGKGGRKIGPVRVDRAWVTVIYSGTGTLVIKEENSPPQMPGHLEGVLFLSITSTGGTVESVYVSIDISEYYDGDGNDLEINFYDGDAKEWVKVTGTSFYPASGTITFLVDHLTVFSIARITGEAVEEEEQEGSSGEDNTMLIIAVVVIVLVIIILLLIVLRRRKEEEETEEGEGTRAGPEKPAVKGPVTAPGDKGPPGKPPAPTVPAVVRGPRKESGPGAPAPAVTTVPVHEVEDDEVEEVVEVSSPPSPPKPLFGKAKEEEPAGVEPDEDEISSILKSLKMPKGLMDGDEEKEEPSKPSLRSGSPSSLRTRAPPSLRTRSPPSPGGGPPSLRTKTPPTLRSGGPPKLRTKSPPTLRTKGLGTPGLKKPPSLGAKGDEEGSDSSKGPPRLKKSVKSDDLDDLMDILKKRDNK